MTRLTPTRRGRERGFALLFVFLMAAAVALMLYRQMPRVAFETERDREQLLIDRGEQYKRAIEMFYRANTRFPSTLEELEKFQDKRYLRRRYKDPMTGKEEWRLVHTNGAFLTDSLVTKPPQATPNGQLPGAGLPGDNQQQAANNTGTPAGQEGPQEVNAAVLRRPSDRLQPEQTGFNQGFNPGFTPGIPGEQPEENFPRFDPNTPITLAPAGQGQPGQQQFPQNQFPQSGQPQFPGQFPQQQFPGQSGQPFPTQQIPGQPPPFSPNLPPQPNFNQQGITQPVQANIPGQPGFNPNQPAFNQPGFNPSQQQFRIGANGQLEPIPPGQNGQGAFNGQPGQPQAGRGGQNAFPNAATPTATGFPPANPTQPLQPGNPAQGIINSILTTPRQQPGGLGLPGGNTGGGVGIAGVASTSKSPSIKIYKEKSKYSEWEFVLDLQQMQQRQAAAGTPGQPNNPLGNTPPGSPTPSPIAPGGGFGPTTGTPTPQRR